MISSLIPYLLFFIVEKINTELFDKIYSQLIVLKVQSSAPYTISFQC